jgi:hypothetical protein
LLQQAAELDEVNKLFRGILTNELVDEIVALIPNEWLMKDAPFANADEHRNAYATFLKTRILHSEIFVKQAQDARAGLI